MNRTSPPFAGETPKIKPEFYFMRLKTLSNQFNLFITGSTGHLKQSE